MGQYSTKCIHCYSSLSVETRKLRRGVNSVMRCNNKKCRKRFSIFIGSIFENSKLNISEILRIMYCFAMKFTLQESKLYLGIPKMTLIEWNRKFRNALIEKYDSLRRTKIGGVNYTVEIDEANRCIQIEEELDGNLLANHIGL